MLTKSRCQCASALQNWNIMVRNGAQLILKKSFWEKMVSIYFASSWSGGRKVRFISGWLRVNKREQK